MQHIATVYADGTASVELTGREPLIIQAESVDSARQAAITRLINYARDTQETLDVLARDPDLTEHHLQVTPEGHVKPAPTPTAPKATPTTAQTTSPASNNTTGSVTPRRSSSKAPSMTRTSEQLVAPSRGTTNKQKKSFLSDSSASGPTPSNWQSLLTRVGIKTGPSAEEVARWEDERTISQHWPGPRTIAVLNGKGGAGKTPATVLLSAMFARAGGSGVLAWDNNITRGTLGWRTEQGPHDANVLDLIPRTEELLNPSARAADLAAVVHHQTQDKFDVLRSNPLLLSTEQKLTPEQLDAVHAVASKYYRLTFMDSGNDEGDALWLRMIDHADQIVVATTTRPDHAEAGRLLLDALSERDEHSAQLAERAVVIVSQADREEADAASIAEGFNELARAVVTVPYDPAMREQWLRVDNLASATRRAYLRAAAEVAAGL